MSLLVVDSTGRDPLTGYVDRLGSPPTPVVGSKAKEAMNGFEHRRARGQLASEGRLEKPLADRR